MRSIRDCLQRHCRQALFLRDLGGAIEKRAADNFRLLLAFMSFGHM
jgi:hypothetical protein